MTAATDRLGFATDRELQLATIEAGWRFYLRASEREDAQQALAEWIDAIDAVLDLGVEPVALGGYLQQLRQALHAAGDGGLERRIRTITAVLEPPPLRGAELSVRDLLAKHGGRGVPALGEVEHVAVDVGIAPGLAEHVSNQLRSKAA